MPACTRKDIVPNGEVGVYHCVNRRVRRTWLCGHDPMTGSCYDHRKQWIEVRLEELAGSFAVDGAGFPRCRTTSTSFFGPRRMWRKHGATKKWLAAGGVCSRNAATRKGSLREPGGFAGCVFEQRCILPLGFED